MLVDPQWVLPANHCIDSNFYNYGGVKIGAHTSPFELGDNGGQLVEAFEVAEVFEHPEYNSGTVDNDFTLLKLDGTSTIPPVPLDDDEISLSYVDGEIAHILVLDMYLFLYFLFLDFPFVFFHVIDIIQRISHPFPFSRYPTFPISIMIMTMMAKHLWYKLVIFRRRKPLGNR